MCCVLVVQIPSDESRIRQLCIISLNLGMCFALSNAAISYLSVFNVFSFSFSGQRIIH